MIKYLKRHLSMIILIATIPVGELHNHFLDNTEIQNWTIKQYKDAWMPVSWNVKLAEQQLILIMYFVAWILYYPNKANKTTVWAFLFLAILDTVMYFWNYKSSKYGSVYLWLLGFWLIVFFWKQTTDYLWKRLKHSGAP